MLFKPLDIITIGDLTTDAFIRLKDAEVHCKLKKEDCELCLRFGSKVPFEYVRVIKATGNAGNAAVAMTKLGLKTAIVSNIGNDENGRDCLIELQKNSVITTHIKRHPNQPTNYHFVLWYGDDRTILVNHINYEYRLPKLPVPKWVYLTSLASDTHPYHVEIAEYLEANPSIKLAFQPGTYQIKLGFAELKRLYARTEFLAVNLEEAQKLSGLDVDSSNPKSITQLLKSLAAFGPKLVAITDGPRGAYLYDGDHTYFMPSYPDSKPALERTGCGDAWSATFVAALALGKTPLEALLWAPVNPMSVAQFIGSQEGLLDRKRLEWWLERADKDYRPRELE